MPKLRTDILEQKGFILECIAQNKSKAFICKTLKCKPETLNSYLEKMGIEYSGNQGLKGQKEYIGYIPAAEYASKPFGVKSHILKEKLLREGIKKHQCECCHLITWNDKPIPLELHHKDGDHYNNDLDNLQILCPNCHAQTASNSGANAGKYTTTNQRE